ncbi:MAG: DUF4097 family beta strand repeat protein [Clostridia bacterium]|nr:DUF4097 family beta strand repeat protein [Clostridia bacterium]
MKKFFKKFFIYLAFIVGILLVAVLGCLAFMYFSPGTSVLGYEYVLYTNREKTTYTTSTPVSISGVQAIEVITEMTDVYILPNTVSGEILVSHSEGLSGFCKSLNSELKLTTKIINKSFEEGKDTDIYKTFSINIEEPTGWIAKSNSYVYVYIPSDLVINTVYVKSNGGNIKYTSEVTFEEENPDEPGTKIEKTSVLECVNLYLKTGDYGKLNIDTKNGIENYYLQTDLGKVDFLDVTTITASTIKFETNSGLFSLINADKTATLTLSKALEIISYDNYVGPTVKIDNLYGDLKVTANNGSYRINQIGSAGVYKTIAMTMNKGYINFGNVYGYVSILSEGSEIENKVNIKNLEYNGATNTIESGAGYINITSLNGNASFDSTSGSIKVGNATVNSNIYAYSTSGNIDIAYTGSTADNKETNLIVLTKTGGIDLKNISCSLDVQVLSKSSSSKLDITFTAVSYNDNTIDAKNRKVNIILKGVSDSLQSRILCTKEVTIAENTAGQLISSVTDQDYIVNLPKYTEYAKAYRLGYTKDDSNYNTNAYDRWGKILLKTTGNVLVSSKA